MKSQLVLEQTARMTDDKGIIEKLDITTIGKSKDKAGVGLIETKEGDEGVAVTGLPEIIDNDDIIPVIIRKVNEITERLNQFKGINTKA